MSDDTAVRVDGRTLTPEAVERVAGDPGTEVRMPAEARDRMERSRDAVAEIVAGNRAAYGINTGFGRLSDVRISRERLEQLQVNLVRSHACGVGEPLDEAAARALVLLRANVLAAGYSGVRPRVVEHLLALLEANVVPVVPRAGSVGASGDLAPAAHAALVLIGEGTAVVEGRRLPGGEALAQAGLEPLDLRPKEGLALLNGTQAMTAVGTLALLRAERLMDVADLAGAMSLEGLRGSPEPFDPAVQRLRPHPGQAESARRLRAALRDSEIRESHRHGDPRVQDAYSLRCMPQVHGTARDTLGFARETLEVEINSATDNPLVVAGEGDGFRVVSNGNFHGHPVAAALDHLTTVLSSVAAISERRTDRLMNPDTSGLPAFLTPEPGLRSGMMMAQVTAASQVAETRHLATPASAGSLPTGAGKEDHVSMGMHAAHQASEAVACLERVLAVEMLAGAQAVEFLAPLEPGRGVAEVLSAVRDEVPRLEEDRPQADDVEAVVSLIRSGRLGQVKTGTHAD